MALARVDSKGRVSLPHELHEIVGDIVEMRPVGNQSVLIRRANVPKNRKINEKTHFVELLDKEPRRTGKPENPAPSEIKSVWNE